MRDVTSTQRRRRLRLIKSVETRGVERVHSAVTALAIASETEMSRVDVEKVRRHLLTECRARLSTKLRVEHPGAAPVIVALNRPYLIVGSDPTCDLRLDHEEIKPRHCFLQWIDGQIFCCDIAPRLNHVSKGSRQPNGCWLNDQPFSIGPYQLSLKGAELSGLPDYSPLDRSPELSIEHPQWGLRFEGVVQSDNLWPVNRMLTMVGRGSQCKLRLNHNSMAIVQACLLRTSNGCWLIDIAGDGSTGVNGRTISVLPIDIGDMLQLGPFQIEVVTTAVNPIEAPAVAIIETEKKTGTEKPLPPIKLDRPLKKRPRKSPDSSSRDDSQQSVLPLATEPKSNSRKSRTSAKPDGAAAESTIRNAGQDSVPMPIVTTSQLAEKFRAISTDATIAQYIQQQQSELTLLKLRLDHLKKVYDAATGQLISKRMRESLEKPVIETTKTYAAMQETLDKLIEYLESQNSGT